MNFTPTRGLVIALHVAVAGILVAGCDTAAPNPTPSSSTTTAPAPTGSSPAASPTASSETPVLGPQGFGALVLGQKLDAALATGLVGKTATRPAMCGAEGETARIGAAGTVAKNDSAGQLFFTGKLGLVAIYAFGDVRTPQGIHIGSTYADVKKVYPDWTPIASEGPEGRGHARISENPAAHYRIAIYHGKVIQLSLDLNNQDCYE